MENNTKELFASNCRLTSYIRTIPFRVMEFPHELQNSTMNGIFVHFGTPIGFYLLCTFNHFDPIMVLISFFSTSIIALFQMLIAEKIAPSVELSHIKITDVMQGLSLVFLKGIGIGSCVVAITWWIFNYFIPTHSSSILCSILLTVAGANLCYYFIHRFLNHGFVVHKIVTWFRKNHSEHHRVKALDFFRGNHSSLVDTAVLSFQIPTGIIGALLGLSWIHALVAYGLVLLLQATHHVNFTFNIGWLRFVFVDNHNHKLHHCPRGYLVNFGAVFSIWDRLFGTCYENWNLSSNYFEKHRIALPIERRKT